MCSPTPRWEQKAFQKPSKDLRIPTVKLSSPPHPFSLLPSQNTKWKTQEHLISYKVIRRALLQQAQLYLFLKQWHMHLSFNKTEAVLFMNPKQSEWVKRRIAPSLRLLASNVSRERLLTVFLTQGMDWDKNQSISEPQSLRHTKESELIGASSQWVCWGRISNSQL